MKKGFKQQDLTVSSFNQWRRGYGEVQHRLVSKEISIICLLAILLSTSQLFGLAPDKQMALGENIYRAHCLRCHGEDGDATDYYNIVPLAGIGRRPPVGLAGRFRGESFSARGVSFSGERARALGRYLFQLRGSKGFPDGGWLWSPYLLSCKTSFLKDCRILDLRGSEVYRKGHIPNAFPFPLGSSHTGSQPHFSIDELLQAMGIQENTQIVLYNETGGPSAAWLWWRISQAGHSYVAVLDGGWANWVASGHPVSDKIPNIARSNYTPKKESAPAGDGILEPHVQNLEWDFKDSFSPKGLKDAQLLTEWLSRTGLAGKGTYQLSGSPEEAAYLVFLMKLLGRSAQFTMGEKGHFLLMVGGVKESLQPR